MEWPLHVFAMCCGVRQLKEKRRQRMIKIGEDARAKARAKAEEEKKRQRELQEEEERKYRSGPRATTEGLVFLLFLFLPAVPQQLLCPAYLASGK